MKNFFGKILKPGGSKDVVIVSGLPRSGTSMMMKMLEAGGMTPHIDHIREADSDNPKGYYEFERVKKLPDGDKDWVPEARGKVVKIISFLLPHLPATCTYRILFMRRNIEEILASQRKMLVNRGTDKGRTSDEEMGELYGKHLKKVEAWLEGQSHIKVLDVNYNEMLRDPAPQVEKINTFLGGALKTAEMTAVVDPALYRQKKA